MEKNLPANARDLEVGSIPGSGRSTGRGHGNLLQYSRLKKPLDRGDWWAIVHRVTESDMTVSSVQFSCSVVSDSLRSHGLQHVRPLCPSLIPRVYPNSCLLSRWCHPTISSSVVLFSSCLQTFPASGYFLVSQFFATGGESIGASASVLPMNIQCWFASGLDGLIL